MSQNHPQPATFGEAPSEQVAEHVGSEDYSLEDLEQEITEAESLHHSLSTRLSQTAQ